jgi:hypothetical protein
MKMTMKRTLRLSCLRIAAIAAVLSFGLCAYAGGPRQELAHAYHLLKKADHDYAGHREKAMNEVQAAGQALGLDLKGDLDDNERQWKSDQQLREARRLLHGASEKLERRDRDLVAAHVDVAIKEIDTALAIK